MKKEEFVGFDEAAYNPIIRPKTEGLLKSLIEQNHPKHILEIGTYVGYSARVMLECDEEISIVTVEKDPKNSEFAKQNLKDFGQRAKVICADAFDFLRDLVAKNGQMPMFDLVFLDGPKGQYVKYLPFLKKFLCRNGLLVADDVLFYGLVQTEGKVAHKHRTIATNLRFFLKQLQDDADFETTVYDFEDGVSVSRKK